MTSIKKVQDSKMKEKRETKTTVSGKHEKSEIAKRQDKPTKK